MIPLMNAAGMVKLPKDVEPLLKVPSDVLSAITLGGYVYSLKERLGNIEQGTTFWDDGRSRATGLNSLGLPGPSWDTIAGFMPALVKAVHESGKKVRVNVSEFNQSTFRDSAARFAALGVDEIEINFGCPNTKEPIGSFNPFFVEGTIDAVYKAIADFPQARLAVKLSPYSDPGLLQKIATIIGTRSFAVKDVVVCNTFPNASGYDHDTEKLLIGANDGLAGLSGAPMKHIMLGQVRQFRRHLPEAVEIIASGGVANGYDVRDAELEGASRCQVGTAFFLQGPRIFNNIATEYVSFMDK